MRSAHSPAPSWRLARVPRQGLPARRTKLASLALFGGLALATACGSDTEESPVNAEATDAGDAGAAEITGSSDGSAEATTDPSEPTEPETTEPTPTTAGGTITTLASPVCGEIVQEEFDPNSSQHVLPGAVPPVYLTDPPTSGPHSTGPQRTGVADEAVPRPEQIGILESGSVIIHHNGLDDAQLAEITPLGDTEGVLVMANADIDPGAVIATAWQHKITCTGPDIAGLQGFVDARLNTFEEDH